MSHLYGGKILIPERLRKTVDEMDKPYNTEGCKEKKMLDSHDQLMESLKIAECPLYEILMEEKMTNNISVEIYRDPDFYICEINVLDKEYMPWVGAIEIKIGNRDLTKNKIYGSVLFDNLTEEYVNKLNENHDGFLAFFNIPEFWSLFRTLNSDLLEGLSITLKRKKSDEIN
jgi:hypothetical protein